MKRKLILVTARTIIGCLFVLGACADSAISQIIIFIAGNAAIDIYAGHVSGKPFYDL